MTTEEAIIQLEIMATEIIGYMATTKNEWAEKKYDALDIAIKIMKEQIERPDYRKP